MLPRIIPRTHSNRRNSTTSSRKSAGTRRPPTKSVSSPISPIPRKWNRSAAARASTSSPSSAQRASSAPTRRRSTRSKARRGTTGWTSTTPSRTIPRPTARSNICWRSAANRAGGRCCGGSSTRLDAAGIACKVVGGTSLALRGLPVPVNDIDIEMASDDDVPLPGAVRGRPRRSGGAPGKRTIPLALRALRLRRHHSRSDGRPALAQGDALDSVVPAHGRPPSIWTASPCACRNWKRKPSPTCAAAVWTAPPSASPTATRIAFTLAPTGCRTGAVLVRARFGNRGYIPTRARTHRICRICDLPIDYAHRYGRVARHRQKHPRPRDGGRAARHRTRQGPRARRALPAGRSSSIPPRRTTSAWT